MDSNMEKTDRSTASVALLASRVPLAAAEALSAIRSPLDLGKDLLSSRTWITTGTGASEGPARVLATLIRQAGVLAEFAPISSFAHEAPRADVCVVVSQRLSPNARVPLSRSASYAHTLLVTTVDGSADAPNDVRVVKHGPRDEPGLLLRIAGPAAAMATCIQIAHEIASFHARNGLATPVVELEGAFASARARVSPSSGSLHELAGFIALGGDVALAEGLRNKVLEGLGGAHPPVWDLCGLVHGPLQSFYDREVTLVLLERDDATTKDLTARLMRVLDPARHHVIRLRSSLPGAYALLDFEIQLDWLVVDALEKRPRDLVDWPGKGCDAPLYELGI
jgi:hypothetical protein